jgi:hypothetical protein
VRTQVAQEVQATKRVWPAIAKGLPAPSASLRAQIERASASAGALAFPAPFGEQESRVITGPASSIVATYRSFAVLARTSWRLIAADVRALEGGTPAAAQFARANVDLYIEGVFDAHKQLAQIGKKLHEAFRKTGGPQAFGAALSQVEIDALRDFYSEASDRLRPTAAIKLGS